MAQNTVHLLIFASDLFRKNFTKLNHHKCLYFYVNNETQRFKPCHEIMALFVLRNLILQTHMHSHPLGLDVLFLVGPFVYYHTSCVQTVKALARLRMRRLRAGSPEPSLVPYVISTIISWAGSFISLDLSIIGKTLKITYLQQLLSSMVCLLLWHCLYVIVRQCWLCWGLTSQSTIFQSCRDGAIASWVINQYFRGVKCLAQGHNTAAVGLEPRTSRSGGRHSTTEPPRSPM